MGWLPTDGLVSLNSVSGGRRFIHVATLARQRRPRVASWSWCSARASSGASSASSCSCRRCHRRAACRIGRHVVYAWSERGGRRPPSPLSRGGIRISSREYGGHVHRSISIIEKTHSVLITAQL